MVHRVSFCAFLMTWTFLFWGCSRKDSPIGSETADGQGRPVSIDSLFADRGLEAAVQTAIGRSEGMVSPQELSSLKHLDAHGLGIMDLSGIGQLDSLQSLDLADNEVIDLAPLASLVLLEYLDLSRNHISEISALASLVHLKVLILEQNAVHDLLPLQGLSHLERLDLTEGMVSASATAGLEARGVEVVWALAEGSPSSGGDTSPSESVGPRVAFSMPKMSNMNDADIWVMAQDGSDLRILVHSAVSETQPAWSPDGTQLAFSKDPSGFSVRDICVLRSGESNPVGLAQERGKDEHSPSWSPNGSQIVYVRDGDIWLMWADGSDQVNLSKHPAKDYDPSWSPDGQRIVFASTRDAGDNTKQSDICLMDSDGENEVNLTRHSSTSFGPSFSPDGTRIAFYTNRYRGGGDSGSYDVCMMEADGSQPSILTATWPLGSSLYRFEDHPSWSSSGQRIICVYHYGICTMAMDGSCQTMLLENTWASHPAWVADAAVDLAGVSQ